MSVVPRTRLPLGFGPGYAKCTNRLGAAESPVLWQVAFHSPLMNLHGDGGGALGDGVAEGAVLGEGEVGVGVEE